MSQQTEARRRRFQSRLQKQSLRFQEQLRAYAAELERNLDPSTYDTGVELPVCWCGKHRAVRIVGGIPTCRPCHRQFPHAGGRNR